MNSRYLKGTGIALLSVIFLLFVNYVIIRQIGLIRHFRYIYETPKYDLSVSGDVILREPKMTLDIEYISFTNVVLFNGEYDETKQYKILFHELMPLFIVRKTNSFSIITTYSKMNRLLDRYNLFLPFIKIEEMYWNVVQPEGCKL